MADERRPAPVGEMKDGRWIKRIWIPRLEDRQRIQVHRLAKELKLEDRAAKDGHLNHPDKNDTTLNAPQLDICNRVFEGILLLNQFLSDQVSAAVKHARELDPPRVDGEGVGGHITEAVDSVLDDRTNELFQLKFAELKKYRDLKMFRFKNGLSRSAHHKESVVLVVGLLIVAFVVESIINGSLLSAVTANGLSEGVLLASAISGLNITLGLIAGYFGWRLCGHRRWYAKGLGVFITLITHSAAIAWNLYIAHFREAAELAVADANYDFNMSALGIAALAQMAVGPLSNMGSIQAWALLLLGLVVHFLSAKEGWDELEDPYFGYKKYDSASVKAQAVFEDALAAVRADARAAAEQIEMDARAAAEQAAENFNEISDLLAIAREREQEVRDSEDEWVVGGNQLLKTYRDINIQIRDENSAPAYFSSYPSADDYRRGAFGAGLQRQDVQARTILTREAFRELEKLRDDARAVMAEADEVLKAVPRQTTNAVRKLEKKLDQKNKDVTSKAQHALDNDDIEALVLSSQGFKPRAANAAA